MKTLFREKNLGCRQAVSQAITWFFEQVEEGIILEDDCVPDLSFFPFCAELLERYRHDTRIMAISGDNYQGGRRRGSASYYFSKYPHCWGWASWRRAWQYYHGALEAWPEFRESGDFRKMCGRKREAQYWTNIFNRLYAGKIDSWAYQWTLTCWQQKGLAALPQVNLVRNIGWGEDATHTSVLSPGYAAALSSLGVVSHPESVRVHSKADRWTDQEIYSGVGKLTLRSKWRRRRWLFMARIRERLNLDWVAYFKH